jgi:hypothetical protein
MNDRTDPQRTAEAVREACPASPDGVAVAGNGDGSLG